MTPIPLTVIGGFLGAGKTTLLNHWLRASRDVRMAVLVNDFGALNIDAALIEASAGDTMALTNGCVCCQIGDDLSLALMRVLDAVPPFDAVVIEASGVSDPWRIAQMGRADPALALDGVIVLVDASAALAQSRESRLADTLLRQLRAADLIVVNKCDIASADERAALRRWIDEVAAPAPVFETEGARVPLAMLSGLAMPSAYDVGMPTICDRGADSHDHAIHESATHEHAAHRHAPDHGDVFESWSCRPAQIFLEADLRRWLASPPPGLLRLKGIVRTGAAAWSELQFAGRHGSLRPAAEPADGAALVAIGLHGALPAASLSSTFDDDHGEGNADDLEAAS